MGTVYAAVDTRTGQDVAVKVLTPHEDQKLTDKQREEVKQRFLREVLAISRINHKHVIKVLDWGFITDGDRPYMVMEFLHGEDLAAHLVKHRDLVKTDYFVDLILELCAAVRAAHEREIIHRDIKTKNVFLSSTEMGHGWDVKLLDFGVAKADYSELSELTHHGERVGTYSYMAPEQLEGRASKATDQYAIGVVLYYCLTRKLPYHKLPTPQLLRAIEKGRFPPPITHRPDLSPALNAIVVKAMAKKETDRFRDVYTLGQRLYEHASPFGRAAWKNLYTHSPVPPKMPAQLTSSIPAALLQRLEAKTVDDEGRTEIADYAHFQGPTARNAHEGGMSPSVAELMAPTKDPVPGSEADSVPIDRKRDINAYIHVGDVSAAASVSPSRSSSDVSIAWMEESGSHSRPGAEDASRGSANSELGTAASSGWRALGGALPRASSARRCGRTGAGDRPGRDGPARRGPPYPSRARPRGFWSTDGFYAARTGTSRSAGDTAGPSSSRASSGRTDRGAADNPTRVPAGGGWPCAISSSEGRQHQRRAPPSQASPARRRGHARRRAFDAMSPVMLSRRTIVIALVAATAGTACRTKPNAESCLATPCASGLSCDSMTQLCTGPDGGTGNDGGPPGSIFIAAPAGPTAYAHGAVTIAVDVTPGSPVPSSVDVLIDGTKLATVASAPPYTTTWDTTRETEGNHQVSARASISGRVVTAAAVTVVVDRKAPMILSQTPVVGAANVLISDPIQIQFTEALDPTTVSASTIGLATPDGQLPVSVTLSSDGTTITVVVSDRTGLTFPATVTETVAATVADLAGNQLATPASWSWIVPRWVTLASVPGQRPSVAIGPDDHPVVSYLSSAGVGLAKYAKGAVWDVSIPSPATGTVTGAAIALDKAGTPFVAWSAGHTFVANWTGSSWDTSAYGNVPDTGVQGSVSALKLDGMGQPVVGWSTNICGMCGDSALVARWNQGAWEALFTGTSPITPGDPLLQVDSAGAPTIWASFKILRFTGGSWLPVDTSGVAGGTSALAVTLALDVQDRPVVVTAVRASPEAPSTLQVQYAAAGSWTTLATKLMTGSSTAPAEVHLALDGNGNPTLVWSEVTSGEQSLHVAKFTGSGWDVGYDPLNGVFGSNTNAANASVVLDAVGAPVVVWQESSGSANAPSIFMWRANR